MNSISHMIIGKRDNNQCDIHDIVLKILFELKHAKNESRETQIFSAVYLDEIQDFSYAMIYLVCSIGGTNNTAQMISPGCSF